MCPIKNDMTEKRFKLLSAVHILLMRDSEILLLRRYNTGYEDGKFSLVAGHLDGNESAKATVIREAREEAGIEIAASDIQPVGVMHRQSEAERIDFFFAVTVWEGIIKNCEPHKCSELSWFALDNLPVDIIPYVRVAIENYRNGVWYSEVGWD